MPFELGTFSTTSNQKSWETGNGFFFLFSCTRRTTPTGLPFCNYTHHINSRAALSQPVLLDRAGSSLVTITRVAHLTCTRLHRPSTNYTRKTQALCGIQVERFIDRHFLRPCDICSGSLSRFEKLWEFGGC